MAAYRYHRLRFLTPVWRASTGWQQSIKEIRLYTQQNQSGTEFATTGTVTDNDNIGASYTSAKTIDNNTSTQWATSTTASEKIWKLDSGSGNAYQIASLSMTVSADANGAYISTIIIVEGSDDNSNWSFITYFVTTNTTTDGYVYNVNITDYFVASGFPLIGGGMIR